VGQLPDVNYPARPLHPDRLHGLRPQDPETLEYERVLAKAYGEKRKGKYSPPTSITCSSIRAFSVQSPLQQLRAVRPLDVDKTLTENLAFRLKGAPEPIYRRRSPTTTWSIRLDR